MWSLLAQKPLSRLGKLSRAKTHETILELADAYSLEKNEIYFDRDPHFECILRIFGPDIFAVQVDQEFGGSTGQSGDGQT